MTIEQKLRNALIAEIARAEADADMSANEDDLAYHNGEIDGLNFALDQIKGVGFFAPELDGVN